MTTLSTTTLTALEANLAALISAINPTFTADQVNPWVYAEDRRDLAPTMVPRFYLFEWGKPEDVRGGATGNADSETACEMAIVADYRAFREEDLGTVAESDFWDIHDKLSDQLSPAVPGFMWIEPVDFVERDAQRVAHVFKIQYLRARRS